MVKIVRFHQFGDADVLQLDELPLAEPKRGEVRLKVEAIGLNRAEVMFRKGAYLEQPDSFPSTLQYIYDGLDSGKLMPIIDRTFSLEQIAEAHRYMKSNQQNGKIIVTVLPRLG